MVTKRTRGDTAPEDTPSPKPTRRERGDVEPEKPKPSAVRIGSGTDWSQIVLPPEGAPKPGEPEYDPDRPGKRKATKPTPRDLQLASFGIAVGMMDSVFGYSTWMSNDNVVGPGGERINLDGEIITAEGEPADEIQWR